MTCRDRVPQTRVAPVAPQEGPGLRWLTVTPRAQWPVTRSSTCRIPGPWRRTPKSRRLVTGTHPAHCFSSNRPGLG